MTEILSVIAIAAPKVLEFLLRQSLGALLLTAPLWLIWLFYREKRLWIESAIWGIFLLRLVIPWVPESGFGLQAILTEWYTPEKTTPLLHLWERQLWPDTAAQVDINILNGVPAAANSTWLLLLAAIYVVGGILLSLVLLHRRRAYRNLLATGKPINNNQIAQQKRHWRQRFAISRKVTILSGDGGSIPFTMGILRPCIFLPQALLAEPQHKIYSAIIAHEMAHIRHWDALKISMIALVQCLFWFNPLVWIAAYRLGQLREEKCDRAVVSSGAITPTAYGWGMLATLELQYFGDHWLAVRSGNTTTRHKMIKRLIFLQKGENLMPFSRYWAIALVICLGLILLPTAPQQGIALANSAPPPAAEGSGEFVTPIKEGKVTSPFGMRMHPMLKEHRMHNGIDVAAETGTPIYAVAAGVVQSAEFQKNYGNKIVVMHDGEYQTLYSQLQTMLVKSGEKVSAGQQIATVGSTGLSTAPHLHFELRHKKKPIDPESKVDFSHLPHKYKK